jgi:hypothetical protein
MLANNAVSRIFIYIKKNLIDSYNILVYGEKNTKYLHMKM